MSRFRKTIPVKAIKEHAQRILQNSSADSVELRQGVIELVESLLLEYSYNGFSYFREEELPEGSLPGCAKDENGEWIFPDPTRRKYL